MQLISSLPSDFPQFQMLGVGLKITDLAFFDATGWNQLQEEIKESIGGLSTEQIRNDPVFRAYRDFYWHHVKVDPTKTRPSSEALTRRLQKKGSLPRIHPIVDSFNLASVETKITVCAYDLDQIQEDLLIRLSEEGEKFLGIGMKTPQTLSKGLVVIEDTGIENLEERR